MLLARTDEVITKDHLLDTVWEGRPTVDAVVANAIAKLRSALGDENGNRIVTQSRVGYRLTGPVERVAVGRNLQSTLDLHPGSVVPQRENFYLKSLIGSSANSEVWLSSHRKTGESRVYKFTPHGDRLAALKREVTLYRVLHDSLGDRSDFVRILDWNFEEPPFYLESEYGGLNLTDWAAADSHFKSLSVDARVGLFLQIADAVAAAHSVGVLHKDLKPTNVLVRPNDGGWQIKVGDFGSGGLLDPLRLDALGITQLDPNDAPVSTLNSTSATPLYIAPELLAGQLPSVQTDVFALGLMLYQMAIGDLRKPLASGWERDIADEFLIEDIAAASDGSPARRLGSVAELAHRLRTRDSRRAARASARYAQQRLAVAEQIAQRTRAQRPWLITAIASLAMGLLVSLFLYHKQLNAERESQRERLRAEQINRFMTEDLLGTADPSGPGGKHDMTIKEVLVQAANRLGHRFTDDPATKSSIEVAIAQAYSGLTDYASSEQHLRDAIELSKMARGAEDPATLDAQYRRALALMSLNRLTDAAALLDDTDHHAGSRLSENSPLAFQAHMVRANFYSFQYSPARALPEFSLADRIRSAIDPDNPESLYRVMGGISWCYVRLNRLNDAESALRPLLAAKYTVESVGPTSWSDVRLQYGEILKEQGHLDEALSITLGATRQLQSSLGADAFFVGLAYDYLSDIYKAQGRYSLAKEALQRTYEIFRTRLGDHAQNTLSALIDLGILDYQDGHFSEAAQKLSVLRDELMRTLDTANPLVQYTTFYLISAETEGRLGDPENAATVIAHLDPAVLSAAVSGNDWEPRLQALTAEIHLRERSRAEDLALLSAAIAKMKLAGESPTVLARYQQVLSDSNVGRVFK